MRGSNETSKILCCSAMVLCVSLISGAPVSSQSQDQDFRFRPDHEREAMRADINGYKKWLEQEGVPVHTGYATNLYTMKMGPWKRLGPAVTGAYVNLQGSGGLVDVIAWEMAVGGQTTAERHLFEEQILVLKGEGETHIWQSDPAKKVVVPWRRGTVFSPPLNAFHQHFNKGTEPARLAAMTDLPVKANMFRSPHFLFNTNYDFTERYSGQPDYFDPENSRDYSPGKSLSNPDHSLSVVNLIRNAWTWRLFHAGQGYGDIDRHFMMSANVMSGHIESWPVGAYQRAHAHGPGATIVHLGGSGYTLMWDKKFGMTPWKDGISDKVTRVDWEEGIVLIPPLDWYHQHFATGPGHAKFIKLGGPTVRVSSGGGENLITYADEDPHVRQLFESEVAKNGAKSLMPTRKELIEMEKEGRMPAIVETKP